MNFFIDPFELIAFALVPVVFVLWGRFMSYEDHKRKAAERQAEQSASGRDIGEIPKVKNKRRRNKAIKSLRIFLETYFPNAFPIAWSRDHVKMIKLIESAVRDGGLQAVAMPRGSGKSTICSRAVIWALFAGHHKYAMLICADAHKAQKILDALKMELEKNVLLLEDFPEICYPIKRLERIANRAKGQTHKGESTDIVWTKDMVVLPTVKGSKASGSVLEVGGITSAVRGGQYTRQDGSVIRPSIVLIDDPQTRESAGSDKQNLDREQIISADLLGMAGPGEQISALMTCTVVYPDDMADRMLNRKHHPEWHGIRVSMLPAMPTDMSLWEQYWEIRTTEMIDDRPHDESNKFYKTNQAAMDEGAEVYWPERFRKDEVSAIQSAMNLYLRDPEAFASEYQNNPVSEDSSGETYWSTIEIARKVNGFGRRQVPDDASNITCFIDVQRRLLYWMVVAWSDGLTGWVLDYGTFPEQRRKTFKAQGVSNTLEKRYQAKLEVAIRRGLEDLTDELFGREFLRDDGSSARIQRIAIDAAWGESTHVIRSFIRASPHAGNLLPSFGKARGAKDSPLSTWKKLKGEWRGLECRIPPGKGREIRHLMYDTHFWKTQAMRRLSTSIGEIGSVSLYGDRSYRHDFLAEQLTAEKPRDMTDEKSKRTVTEWSLPSGTTENHWFDCYVGNCVLANTLGIYPPGYERAGRVTSPKRKKRARHFK